MMDPREAELEACISKLTGELSEVAIVEMLPRMKELYEDLHPETRHGGSRAAQVLKMETWPRFTKHVADRTGASESTVRRRLDAAETLAKLDDGAWTCLRGTRLTNQLKVVLRIAAIPQADLQQRLVQQFLKSERDGKKELKAYEESLGLGKKPSASNENETAAPSEDADAATVEHEEESSAPDDNVGMGDGDADPGLAASDTPQEGAVESAAALASITTSLAVNSASECLDVIETLKKRPTLEEYGALQETVLSLRKKNAELEKELDLFRSLPAAELFRILDVTNARDALKKARALTEASRAS